MTETALPHPFLHTEREQFSNPLSGEALTAGDDGFAALAALIAGEQPASEQLRALRDGSWLLDPGQDPARQFRLRYVSLETSTVCNDACYFCPVSIAPRPRHVMSDSEHRRILGELSEYSETIEAVFLNNYNEPTIESGFVGRVEAIRASGLPPALLSNGSGLTPKRAEALLEIGGLDYLAINLHTLDAERYERERGSKHLAAVVRNLDYLKDLPLAPQMKIVALGRGDAEHHADIAGLRARYGGSRLEISPHTIENRAGYIKSLPKREPIKRLRGCQNLGSRLLEHLHITAHGRVVICCEDYDENHVVGDLATESVGDILTGDALARLRRLAYGLEDAPEDFICRHCEFALGE